MRTRSIKFLLLLSAFTVPGCLSIRARTSRLADFHIARVEARLRADPAGGADEAIRVYTRFLLRLPLHPDLDAVRAKILKKRGEAYIVKGQKDMAKADFEEARRLEPPLKSGLPPRTEKPAAVARRFKEGTLFTPPSGPKGAVHPSPTGVTSFRVMDFLHFWGALPILSRMRRDSSRVHGTDINLHRDLDIAEPALFPWFAAHVRCSDRLSIGFEISGGDLDGSAFQDSEVRYDGATFPSGEVLEGKFRILDTGLFLRSTTGTRGPFSFGVEVGVRTLRFQTRLTSGGFRKEDTLDAFFPVMGILVEKGLPQRGLRFALGARICGFYWGQGETSLQTVLVDIHIGLEVSVLPTLSVTLGARGEYLSYSLSRDDEEKGLDLGFIGPVLGVVLRL